MVIPDTAEDDAAVGVPSAGKVASVFTMHNSAAVSEFAALSPAAAPDPPTPLLKKMLLPPAPAEPWLTPYVSARDGSRATMSSWYRRVKLTSATTDVKFVVSSGPIVRRISIAAFVTLELLKPDAMSSRNRSCRSAMKSSTTCASTPALSISISVADVTVLLTSLTSVAKPTARSIANVMVAIASHAREA